MNKRDAMIGAIIGVILSVLTGLGIISSDLKGSICSPAVQAQSIK